LAIAKQHSIKLDENNMNTNQTNLVQYTDAEWEQYEWDCYTGEPVKKKPRNRGQNRKIFARDHLGHYKKGIPQRDELSLAAEKLSRPQHVESC
jgi:hypothetical protein